MNNGNASGNMHYYYNNGQLIFEGEYINANSQGTGQGNSNLGQVLYEGEYVNGSTAWN